MDPSTYLSYAALELEMNDSSGLDFAIHPEVEAGTFGSHATPRHAQAVQWPNSPGPTTPRITLSLCLPLFLFATRHGRRGGDSKIPTQEKEGGVVVFQQQHCVRKPKCVRLVFHLVCV